MSDTIPSPERAESEPVVATYRRTLTDPGETRTFEVTLRLAGAGGDGLRGALDNFLSAVDGAISKAVQPPQEPRN